MNGISITKANDRYSCNLCKKRFTFTDNLYEINIGRINVCLCTDCFRKVRMQMYNVDIDPEEGVEGMNDIEIMQILGEVADDCFFRKNCDSCKFDKNGSCILKGTPDEWDIEELTGECRGE